MSKANSPHYRPDLNDRGVYDGNPGTENEGWSDNQTATIGGLEYLDCHNAHGSNVTVRRSWKVNGTGHTPDTTVGGMLVGAAGRWSGWNYTPTQSTTANRSSRTRSALSMRT